MLKEVKESTVKVACIDCGSITAHDFSGLVVPYLDEFKEYQNVVLSCPCGTSEVFNINIPVDAEDEKFKTGELPLNEEIQRYYVRILQRLVRPDLKRS